MDEFDAPRKIPVEQCERSHDLKDIEDQVCQLFEEFLSLDDIILDAPFSAFRQDRSEVADSPVYVQQSGPLRRKGHAEQKEVLQVSDDEDDVVADSAPAPPRLLTPAAIGQAGPDDKMKQLAKELAKAGDQLVKEHGEQLQDTESKIAQLVTQEALNLSYERFSNAVDDLIGRDKNWTNFVFVACVAKRICKHTQEGLSTTKNYFQSYIQSYSQTMQENGGMESFLRSQGRTRNTPH